MTRALAVGLVILTWASACASPVRMAVAPGPHTGCRASTPEPTAIRWIRPEDDDERRALDERCAQVGPPIVAAASAPRVATRRVLVATWNVHDGRGDVLRLVDDLRRATPAGSAPDAIVVLLQEVVRTMAPVDRHGPDARAARPRRTDVRDIPSIVARLGWHFTYVPGKRNRLLPDGAAAADRGLAILSSLPLTDIEAIELPVERQRRIALAAVVGGTTVVGRPWRLRVVTVHLENRSGARRFWARAGASRTRQTEALLDALSLSNAHGPAIPVLLGGDFNTWLGQRETALRLLHEQFGTWPAEDTRPTIDFREWRLDYLFARLPPAVRTSHRRLDSLYGSDHYPVVAAIDFGAN